MKLLSYLLFQMKLEGIGIVNDCLLRQVEAVPDGKLPLMLVTQLANGELVAYYAEAIPPDLQRKLAAVEIEFPEIGRLLDVLKSHPIQFELGHYKTYVFPSKPVMEVDVLCLPKQDARVKAFGFDGLAAQIYAIERNGVLASACVSTRENEMCGEAWVYTAPEYRKQGLAQKAVNAWAAGLLNAGKIPFYSHKIENSASANLAKKLGLLPVFEEIAITQM